MKTYYRAFSIYTVNLNKSIIEIESVFFHCPRRQRATLAQREANSVFNELKNNNTIDCRYIHLSSVYVYKRNLSAHTVLEILFNIVNENIVKFIAELFSIFFILPSVVSKYYGIHLKMFFKAFPFVNINTKIL